VLGLIFLKFADNKHRQHEDAILAEYQQLKGTRRERSLQDIAIEKCGFALGPQARYDYLLNLPEKEDIPKAIRAAMASDAFSGGLRLALHRRRVEKRCDMADRDHQRVPRRNRVRVSCGNSGIVAEQHSFRREGTEGAQGGQGHAARLQDLQPCASPKRRTLSWPSRNCSSACARPIGDPAYTAGFAPIVLS
jgi:hypothetical protein